MWNRAIPFECLWLSASSGAFRILAPLMWEVTATGAEINHSIFLTRAPPCAYYFRCRLGPGKVLMARAVSAFWALVICRLLLVLHHGQVLIHNSAVRM